MRTAAKTVLTLAASLLVAMGLAGSAYAADAPAGGITITPAVVTLRLVKGSDTATAAFTISNTYAADIHLHFAIEKADEPGNPDTARQHITFAASDLNVPAGGQAKQILTLSDAPAIAPGSQTTTMVMSYGGMSGQGVGVLPSMRLPVTVIKEDGAVTSLGLTNIAGPSIAMVIPSSATVTLHNTGNMVAIPRGTITIVTPGGDVVASGVLNEASHAVSPGANIKLTAKLTKIADAGWPGPYQIHVTYGLGGDAAARTSSAGFLFIAWWHLLIMAFIAAGAWYIVRQRQILRLYWHQKHRKKPAPPKRELLLERDIT